MCNVDIMPHCIAAEQATDNAASAGNIALHMQICDAVNSSDAG